MPAIKELQRKAQRAYFHTKAILKGDANPKLCLQLFDAMVKPILLYGSDVWGGFGHSKKQCENFISKILSKDLSPFENLHLKFKFKFKFKFFIFHSTIIHYNIKSKDTI